MFAVYSCPGVDRLFYSVIKPCQGDSDFNKEAPAFDINESFASVQSCRFSRCVSDCRTRFNSAAQGLSCVDPAASDVEENINRVVPRGGIELLEPHTHSGLVTC